MTLNVAFYMNLFYRIAKLTGIHIRRSPNFAVTAFGRIFDELNLISTK